MKKQIYLLFLISTTLPLLGALKKSQKLNRWESTYSVPIMGNKALSSLASGVYYLMLENPTNSKNVEATISSFHDSWKEFGLHPDCYNALVKAYEEAILSYTNEQVVNKNKIWKETLSQYYENVLDLLKDRPATITFGKHKGKALSSSLKKVPKIDHVLHNLHRPKAIKTTPKRKPPINITWGSHSI